MKKLNLMNCKKFDIYVKKSLVLIRIIKSQFIVITGAAHDICNLRYKIPKEILGVFHNGCTYDYHFIIKQLAKESVGEFECLGENSEKYITFSAPIKKNMIMVKQLHTD